MSARAIGALLALLALPACGRDERPGTAPAPAAAPAPATFVGREACAACHPEPARRWRGSHHDLAMQEAGEESLLGDFDGAGITHFGVTTRFFRRDGRFFVNSDGPDGALRDYEIAYAFGVEPLQQVLIRFPGGRLQALGVAWDAPGRRWFHLHPDEPVPHGDVLHWTGPNQTWNSQCAECHSTGLRKGYLPGEDRYETTWSEVDVSCEACHGPGSAHVAWAEAGAPDDAGRGLLVRLRNDAQWTFDPGAAIARRTGPEASDAELDACGRCHARRGTLREEYVWGRPLLDTHRPALLEEGLYHADGQILDEVYVWGSFLQSRMHAAGVVCSDCHDPHALRIEGAPDAACGRCHRPEVFAAPAHHHHRPGTPGARCVECHMPARTYMLVDPRRDHSFRVPRPDLGARLGTPDACTGCHADRDARWAARAAQRWYGPARAAEPHWAEALHAGRRRLPGAAHALAALAGDAARPGIVRATALRLLREADPPPPEALLARAAGDADPLVRMAAAEAAEALEPRARLVVARPLLRDPLLGVRSEAARVLAGVPPGPWAPGERAALADALAEYRAAQLANAERPEAHLNLGLLHAGFGEIDEARAEYATALRLAPWFVPAWINLADLERQAGREAEAEAALRRALEIAPELPDLEHALGLALVRQKRLAEALGALGLAAERAPEQPRYAYVYAVALHSAGQTQRALALLAEARRRHPGDRELLAALATLSRDAGDPEAARRYARDLVAVAPDDPGARRLLAELEGGP